MIKELIREGKYKIETVNLSHDNGIYSVIQLNNGRIASGGFDNMIKIWNVNSFELFALLFGHKTWVCILLQLKNELLVSGGLNEIKLWNVYTFQCLLNIDSMIGNPRTIIQLKNDNVVVAGKTCSIKHWTSSFSKSKVLIDIKETNALIELEDERLAYNSDNDHIRLWDYKLSILKTLIGDNGPVTTLLQLKDKRLLSMHKQCRDLNIWNVDSLECLITIRLFFNYNNGTINQLHNSNIAFCGDYGLIKIYDVDTMEKRGVIKSKNPNNGSIVQLNDHRIISFANPNTSCLIRDGDYIDIITLY